MNEIVPASPIDYSYAVGLGVGSYAVGAVMFTPDIMRFAKSTKAAVIAMIITLMLGNTFMLLSAPSAPWSPAPPTWPSCSPCRACWPPPSWCWC